jgi:hypothetical protein
MGTMVDQTNAPTPTVWAIDSRTATYYNLLRVVGTTEMGDYQAVPVVMVSGTHEVVEWRVWSNLLKSDSPEKVGHVGFVEIDPKCDHSSPVYRIKVSARDEWSVTTAPDLHSACSKLQFVESVRLHLNAQ